MLLYAMMVVALVFFVVSFVLNKKAKGLKETDENKAKSLDKISLIFLVIGGLLLGAWLAITFTL